MEVRSYGSANDFLQACGPKLIENEAENVLMLSLAQRMASGEKKYDNPQFRAVLSDSGVALLGLRTPPYYQILSNGLNERAVQLLVDDLLRSDRDLPGVIGPSAAARLFCSAWQARTGAKFDLVMHERIHKLTEVNAATLKGASRTFRKADESEAELLADWMVAFETEIGDPNTAQRAGRNECLASVKDGIAAGRLNVLCEGEKVLGCANVAGGTVNSKLVNFVYTPPEFRGKGVATECVAKLSEQLLRKGAKFCALYTDLTNPTSNGIYHKIGYRPVIDVEMWKRAST